MVWIVEMWNGLSSRWEATVGVSLTRSDGRIELLRWRDDNPSDDFRLRPYVPKGE